MNQLAQRFILAAIVMTSTMLWLEPVATRSLGGSVIKARQTVAQRYPLRARSNNFYNRSKISYTRGK